jgi:hypothetical protein
MDNILPDLRVSRLTLTTISLPTTLLLVVNTASPYAASLVALAVVSTLDRMAIVLRTATLVATTLALLLTAAASICVQVVTLLALVVTEPAPILVRVAIVPRVAASVLTLVASTLAPVVTAAATEVTTGMGLVMVWILPCHGHSHTCYNRALHLQFWLQLLISIRKRRNWRTWSLCVATLKPQSLLISCLPYHMHQLFRDP